MNNFIKDEILLSNSFNIISYFVLTDSFIDSEGNCKPEDLKIWARMHKLKYCTVFFSSTNNKEAKEILEKYRCEVGSFEYENSHIIYRHGSGWKVCGFFNEKDLLYINNNTNFEKDSLFSIGFDSDYIVICDLDYRRGKVWDFIKKNSKVLTPIKAIEHLRVRLVNQGIYYPFTDEEERAVGSEWLYLTYRLRTVFPSYQLGWQSVASRIVFQEKEAIIMSSLGSRLEFLLKTIDLLLYHSNKNSGNSQLNINYNFTYFIMLVTGCFDSIAWLCDSIYDINHSKKMQVTLKKTDTENKKGNSFIEKIKDKNRSLGEYLEKDKNQSRIQVFYPFRDSVIHREILQTMTVGSSEGYTALELNNEMLLKIIQLPDYDREIWGIDEYSCIAANKFMPKIIDHFIKLYNEILNLIDWRAVMKHKYGMSDDEIELKTSYDPNNFWKEFHFPDRPIFW